MEFLIDKQAGIARIAFSGTITPDSIIAAVIRMLDHPDFEPDMPSLWDYRGCTLGDFSMEELKRIGDVAHNTSERNHNARIALVTNDDLQFGLSRMFIMMNEITHLDFKAFRDLNAAEQWILDGAS